MKAERDGREIYCKITDAYGSSVKTNTVKMNLKEAAKAAKPEAQLTITSQPSSTSAAEGETVKFTVKAKGDDLKYQWYYRNAGSSSWKKASSTKATHTTTMKKDRDGRQFYCKITDAHGNTVKTNKVKMTMED